MRSNALGLLSWVVSVGCVASEAEPEDTDASDAGTQTGSEPSTGTTGAPPEGSTSGPTSATTSGSTTSNPTEESSSTSENSGGSSSTGEAQMVRTVFIADETEGVVFWDDVDALTEDEPAHGHLGGIIGTPLELLRWNDRLIVATDDLETGLFIFDDIEGLSDGSEPDDVITTAVIGGPITQIWFDAAEVWATDDGDLWIGRYDSFQRLAAGASLGSAATDSVHFSHPWSQLVSGTVDPTSGTLYGAQVSGAGLLAWSDATTAPSNMEDPSFTVMDAVAVDAVNVVDDVLVAGGDVLRLWQLPAMELAPALVSLGADNGIDARVSHVTLAQGRLFASIPSGGRVAVFDLEGATDPAASPEFLLAEAIEPAMTLLDQAGELWVLDRNGVFRYSVDGEGFSAVVKLQQDAADPRGIVVVMR